MSGQRFLHIKNGSNFAHTLLSTICSYAENPPEFFFKMIRLLCALVRAHALKVSKGPGANKQREKKVLEML